jgi:translocation and assembly module TamA
VAARVRLGTLLTPFTETGERQQSAIVNRFFSGGSTGTSSMRGFNSRRLSPLYLVNPGSPPEEWEFIPIGGNSLFESSVEARYRVVGDLFVASFYDTGFVGEEHLRLADEQQAGRERRGLFGSTHYHAVGLGIRYLTVVGPIRLDIGYRLPIGGPLTVRNVPPSGTIPGPTCFGFNVGADGSYAGAPEDICTFHLSIGEAF